MKGKMKKVLCGLLASIMLLSVPTVAQARTITIAGIETEVIQCQPVKAENSKINTKAKTLTLYAGLQYGLRGNGFKSAKATWKISNKKYATIKSHSNGAATLKANKAGKFTITAQQGKKKYTYKVTIKEDFSKHFLDTKSDGDIVKWNKIPGADGYLVCLQYFSECGIDPDGWKDRDIIKIKDIKGNSKKSYQFDVNSIENWDYYWKNNWFFRVKPYKNIDGKVIYSTEYPEDMTFNQVKLK